MREEPEGIVLRGKLGEYLYRFFADTIQYKDYYSFLKDKRYIIFNGDFCEKDTVKRFQFAIVLTRIVFEKGLEVYYEHPKIPYDLKKDIFYFNPVILVLGLKLMELEDGNFYPDRYLKFREMLNAFERIKLMEKNK
uniref:Uncharacterized protein n=1 Tax=candidate division WOR-3 bacterium TaxID=2052148 RepID=A0A7C4U7Y2_UNCW3